MTRYAAVAVLLLFCSALFAGDPREAGPVNAGFEKMKSLAGTWKGTEQGGKKISLTYKVVSGGSAVMETNNSDKHKDGMISMFHLDGERLLMTHYCSLGNQPRMQGSALTPDGKLAFMFVDGTNMVASDPHMHALTITFHGKDKITEDWTMQSEGKDQMHAVMELTRVR